MRACALPFGVAVRGWRACCLGTRLLCQVGGRDACVSQRAPAQQPLGQHTRAFWAQQSSPVPVPLPWFSCSLHHSLCTPAALPSPQAPVPPITLSANPVPAPLPCPAPQAQRQPEAVEQQGGEEPPEQGPPGVEPEPHMAPSYSTGGLREPPPSPRSGMGSPKAGAKAAGQPGGGEEHQQLGEGEGEGEGEELGRRQAAFAAVSVSVGYAGPAGNGSVQDRVRDRARRVFGRALRRPDGRGSGCGALHDVQLRFAGTEQLQQRACHLCVVDGMVGGVWLWGLWGGTCCSSAVILSLAAEASLSTRSRAHASAIPCHPSPNS